MSFLFKKPHCIFLLFAALLPPVAPAGAARQGPPAQAARPRTLSVTVTDEKGGFVAGLKREDFRLFDGKQETPIISFHEGDAPASVGIILDASSSMYASKGRHVRQVRDALPGFLAGGNPSNEYFLVAFNHRPQLFVADSKDPKDVLLALDQLAAADGRGLTALYDALYLAVDRSGASKHARRALLLITDGQDNSSEYSFPDVRRALRESDVTVYTIGLVSHLEDPALSYAGRAVLEEIADSSGGMAFVARDERELRAALEQVSVAIRSQYAIGFAPGQGKGGWRDLKIKLAERRDPSGKKVRLRLYARKGFYEGASSR